MEVNLARKGGARPRLPKPLLHQSSPGLLLDALSPLGLLTIGESHV